MVKVVAEEIRTNQDEPPSQSTTIQLAFIPPGPISNISAAFGATEYIALLDENSVPGTSLDLAQATINIEPGENVILELENNNGINSNNVNFFLINIKFLFKVPSLSYLIPLNGVLRLRYL